MPDKLQEKLYELTTQHFHRWYGFLSSVLLLWVVSLGVYKLLPANDWFKWYAVGIAIISVIIAIGWWFHVYHYPKRSKKRLGVVIAVCVETNEDLKFFQKDFIQPFKEKIADQKLPFDVLVLKNHQSEKIETVEDAQYALKKTRGHFIVWGHIKRREHQSKEQYIFSLRAMVIHSPITEVQKVVLVKDFDALLKNKFIFEKNIQYIAFDARSSELFSTVNYITGRASMLSGDISTAITLHESLLNSIRSGTPSAVSVAHLEKILSFEYALLAEGFYMANGQRVNADFIRCVSAALGYDSKNYSALMKQAIVDFNDGIGDPKKALATLNKAKGYGRFKEWLYSKAFLHLWLGEYAKALKECQRLKKKIPGNDIEVATQVCANTTVVLGNFPDKVQLHFWLGFLYYIKIQNMSMADTEFQKLIDNGTANEKDLIAEAQAYLQDIKKTIGY